MTVARFSEAGRDCSPAVGAGAGAGAGRRPLGLDPVPGGVHDAQRAQPRRRVRYGQRSEHHQQRLRRLAREGALARRRPVRLPAARLHPSRDRYTQTRGRLTADTRQDRPPWRTRGKRARVTFLLVVLAGVLLWGWRDIRSRRGRNEWTRPLGVAVVLVRLGPLDDAAVRGFASRVSALGDRLTAERRRYTPGAPAPFAFTCVGPVDAREGPPVTEGEGWLAAAEETWALWRWTSKIDATAGLEAGAFDSRVYVAAKAPVDEERAMVEGESEEGGRIGAVEVELDASMVDLALFVAAHELFHTLGAADQYDASGHTLIPGGLADPERVPLLPQAFAEVMARNRPVQAGIEVPPETLDELAVGPETARAVGWIR